MTLGDALWIALFSGITAGGVQVSRIMFRTWLSPLSLFLGINSLSLACYHLRLVDMKDVSADTHLVVLGGFLVFVLGVVLASDRQELGKGEKGSAPMTAGLGLFFYTTALLSTVGWLIGAAAMVGRFGILGLLRNIWLLQENFQQQFLGYLNVLGILVLPTFVIRTLTGTRRFLDPVLAASSLFGLLLAGIKSYSVYSCLAALLVWSALRPRAFKVRYLAVVLGVLLVFFVVYTSHVDIFSTDAFVLHGPLRMAPQLARPWVYFTGPWPAMDNVVAGTAPAAPRWGTVVLQPVWKILGDGLGLVDPIPLPLPFTPIGAGYFNVYSFMGEIYWDWKLPGTLLMTFLLGLVTTRLYLLARRAAYWGHALVYGVVGYGLFLTSFMYTFRFNMMVMLAYLWLVGFILVRGRVLAQGGTRE